MKLRNLRIELETYGEMKGQYQGYIEYEGKAGSVKLSFPPEISARLLEHIGEDIHRFSEMAACTLEKAVAASVAEARATPLLSRP